MKKLMYLLFFLSCSAVHAGPPKLIVQIVVDQLRGDLLQQYQQQFTPNGFNYLLHHGINFQNAHHSHANTTTCAGHATIATGAPPALHGIINNEWFDRKSKQLTYCMEDTTVHTLPTQHSKTIVPGRSPRNLYASTLSDELILAQRGQAFAVSLKDRSAIALAGHAGKAFWFDSSNGGFISSDYYYQSYPRWVTQWNQNYHADDFEWTLSRPRNEYLNANSPVLNNSEEAFGLSFPHHVTHNKGQNYFAALAKTPRADQLTAQFAKELLINEYLGLNKNKSDYLGISFSVVDVIGHQFGPNSLESEENLLQLDKTLADLFKSIDRQVGLQNTLIILTADHGVNNASNYLAQHQIETAAPNKIAQLELTTRHLLQEKYNLPAETLLSITFPYVYLDQELIEKHQKDLHEICTYLSQKLTLQPGIFRAYPLAQTDSANDWLGLKVNKMYFPYRSGDVYLVQAPNYFNDNFLTHGSPWNYDSFVPLLFSNKRFTPMTIARPVATTDIAATLAALLKIKQPSATVGQPLAEVVRALTNKGT